MGRALPSPLIWTKSNRTAAFFRATFPSSDEINILRQGCKNCGILASWLRGNGERMGKRRGNGKRMRKLRKNEEMKRKWRGIDSLNFLILSLHFLPLSPFPHSLSISSLSLKHALLTIYFLLFLAVLHRISHL